MKPRLIIPAAGRGSRLKSSTIKPLTRLKDRPLISYVIEAAGKEVSGITLVISPGTEDLFREAKELEPWVHSLEFVVQPEPLGSLDAVQHGLSAVKEGTPAIVAWSDQVGVSSTTFRRVARLASASPRSIVLPLVDVFDPYVWFEERENRIVEVFRKRDGAQPVSRGLSDLGVFGFGSSTVEIIRDEGLPSQSPAGAEADFVYALPCLFDRFGHLGHTFVVEDSREAIGINTNADLEEAKHVVD